jgi:hypothetical protein
MFGLQHNRMSGIGRSIQRVMTIDGVVLPAFIHNGGYFFINLPVYADGLVDAWDLLDRQLFEEKLAQGWVTTSIPDGESIHVHGLGSWGILGGRWKLSPRQLGKLVQQCVRELNPEMSNLYNCHGRTTRKVGKVNVSVLGMPRPSPVRPMDKSPLHMSRGRSLSVFSQEDDTSYLADLRVFEDGFVEVGRLPTPRTIPRNALAAEISAGRLFTKPSEGQRVHIDQLGSFVVNSEGWAITSDDLLLETADLFAELSGQPTSIQKCRACYDAFLAAPTVANREALREVYEAVPEHNRMYLGDMDTKDVPIRMIIYGKQELENWSHRIVARELGDSPLPIIFVPDVLPDGGETPDD